MSVHIPMKAQSRRELGAAIKRWMRQNEFSQQNIHDWAVAAESEGPWNSQLSLFTTDNDVKRLDPKSQFWVSLGRFNRAVADNDTPPSLKRLMVDRIKAAEPFLNANNEPATATDLFSMFIGEQPLPDLYTRETRRLYTEDDVPHVTEICRSAFRKIAEEQMLSPREAWERLRGECQGMNATQVAKFKGVLSGWDEWTVDEINDLTPQQGLGYPAQALCRMGQTLMVPKELIAGIEHNLVKSP